MGHQAGDEVLAEVANRLRACSRADDLCARSARAPGLPRRRGDAGLRWRPRCIRLASRLQRRDRALANAVDRGSPRGHRPKISRSNARLVGVPRDLRADHVVATVGDHVATGHVRRIVSGQKESRARQLGRTWDPPHWRELAQLITATGLPVRTSEGRRRLDESGCEHVDAYGRRERLRIGLGSTEDGVLRGRVLRSASASADDYGRDDVAAAPVPLTQPPCAELVDSGPGTFDVNIEDLVPTLSGHCSH